MWYRSLCCRLVFLPLAWVWPNLLHAAEYNKALLLHLSQLHSFASLEQIKEWAPVEEATLIAIADDPHVLRLARIHAIALLGSLQTPTSFAYLQSLALNDESKLRFRLAATNSLFESFADHPKTVATLARLLQHDQVGLRQYAVLGLARINSFEAQKLLRNQQRIERNVVVRTALRKVMQSGQKILDEGIFKNTIP